MRRMEPKFASLHEVILSAAKNRAPAHLRVPHLNRSPTAIEVGSHTTPVTHHARHPERSPAHFAGRSRRTPTNHTPPKSSTHFQPALNLSFRSKANASALAIALTLALRLGRPSLQAWHSRATTDPGLSPRGMPPGCHPPIYPCPIHRSPTAMSGRVPLSPACLSFRNKAKESTSALALALVSRYAKTSGLAFSRHHGTGLQPLRYASQYTI